MYRKRAYHQDSGDGAEDELHGIALSFATFVDTPINTLRQRFPFPSFWLIFADARGRPDMKSAARAVTCTADRDLTAVAYQP